MDETNFSVKRLGEQILEIGSALISCGANTSRIRTTVERIAEEFDCQAELVITNRAIILTLKDEAGNDHFSSLKRTAMPGVNFKMVSGISRMSWRILEEKWTLDQIEAEMDRLKNLARYPRWVVLLSVSIAGAAFCRLFGGEIEMIFAFFATLAGLFVRQEATRLNYNFYLCILMASTVSALIAGLAVKFQIGEHPESALSTSVLYLIPGVPLINCFSDLIDGNIMNGLIRGVNASIIAFSIAAGLVISVMVYNLI